jgi:hypothetical protein
MSKVLQIRDVPDDVHDALTRAAREEGLSLTRYVLRELDHLARRTQVVRHNSTVIRQTQEILGAPANRETILAVLHEGRDD